MATEPGRPPGLPIEADEGLPNSLWGYEFQVPEERSASETPTGLIDLGYLGAAWRRGRRVWVTLAVIGLVIGLGLYLNMKSAYSATANVILANDPNQDAYTAMLTASQIAQEPAVAELALKNLGLPGPKLPYSVTIIDNQVIAISLNAATGAEAVREVDAVAKAFLTIRNQVDKAFVTATLKGESGQLAQDQRAVSALNHEISQVNSRPASSARTLQLNKLQSQLSLAGNALSALAAQQATLKVTEADMRSGSRILSTSLPAAAHAGKKVMLEYVAGPFFGALVLGLGIVAVRAMVSDRLFRRDDVAIALDAPVRMSVISGASGRRFLRGRNDERAQESDLTRVAECVHACVPANSAAPTSLAIVAIGDPAFAAAALVRLAGWYAREGKRVVVADLAGGALAQLLGVTKPGVHVVDTEASRAVVVLPGSDQTVPVGPRSTRVVPGTVQAEVAGTYSRCDVMLTLITLDPAVGADHLSTWAGDAVAAVTAGAASVARVQAAGEMIRHAGTRLVAGILLGAEKQDESLGLNTI